MILEDLILSTLPCSCHHWLWFHINSSNSRSLSLNLKLMISIVSHGWLQLLILHPLNLKLVLLLNIFTQYRKINPQSLLTLLLRWAYLAIAVKCWHYFFLPPDIFFDTLSSSVLEEPPAIFPFLDLFMFLIFTYILSFQSFFYANHHHLYWIFLPVNKWVYLSLLFTMKVAWDSIFIF